MKILKPASLPSVDVHLNRPDYETLLSYKISPLYNCNATLKLRSRWTKLNELSFLLVSWLSLPLPVGSPKQKMQFGKNHPTVTLSFKQIESIRVSVDKSKCQVAPPSLPDWWWWRWWMLLKILSDLQMNICSPGAGQGNIWGQIIKYLENLQFNICSSLGLS